MCKLVSPQPQACQTVGNTPFAMLTLGRHSKVKLQQFEAKGGRGSTSSLEKLDVIVSIVTV